MTKKMMEQQGVLYAILSGFFYSLLGYFGIRIMDAHFSVANMLFWRFLFASFVMVCLLIPRIKTLHEQPRELMKIFFFGSAFHSATALFYFMASQHMGTGLAMVLFFTYPVIIMLTHALCGQKGAFQTHYKSMMLIVLGIILLANPGELTLDVKGIFFGITSAAAYAGYIMTSKRAQVSPLVSAFMVSVGCTVTCCFLAFITDSFAIPASGQTWANIIGIGVICTALPILFLLKALQHISSEQASILSVLEPVFVVIFGMLLLDEKIHLVQAVGVLVILFSALLTLFNQSAKQAIQGSSL